MIKQERPELCKEKLDIAKNGFTFGGFFADSFDLNSNIFRFVESANAERQ